MIVSHLIKNIVGFYVKRTLTTLFKNFHFILSQTNPAHIQFVSQYFVFTLFLLYIPLNWRYLQNKNKIDLLDEGEKK
jgi:hypothetical protein